VCDFAVVSTAVLHVMPVAVASVVTVFFQPFNEVGLYITYYITLYLGGVGSVVERRSLADVLSLSFARPAANG